MEETVENEPEFQVYTAEENNGNTHSILRVPTRLPSKFNDESLQSGDVFNILMADVSGSMSSAWPAVVQGWQASVQASLNGYTKIYVFGSKVDFLRTGTELFQSDFVGSGTDLTSALRTVRHEVNECSETNVRVFIITDGQHGYGSPLPDTEINLMQAPPGKTISVYLLGIGNYFPVEYSINIRSCLHNGNANMPSLFWAKEYDDIVDEMCSIANEVRSGTVTLNLNHNGYILPGLDKTCTIHLGEWIFFTEPPEKLPALTAILNDIEYSITYTSKTLTVSHLLDNLFRQWNSVLIQQHRKKEHVPLETFDLMDALFQKYYNDLVKSVGDGKDIKTRLANKKVKTSKVQYATLMNQSKTIIGLEGKYQSEIELAETILKTTVTTRKYDVRNLKLKGHSMGDYEIDVQAFKTLYENIKDQILALPPPTTEECCRITITSTLQDLQDPNFPLMFEENKFDLLKNFSMTGIPVYAPIRDASQINPWTMVIKHILVSPFTVLSQQVLEASAETDGQSISTENKDVLLQQDDENTRFNVIVPVVPAHAAEILKPLIKSNLYAMMATFCILKNPHIIDFNAHLAALGCTWIRTLRQFPIASRPEFARVRLQDITATANIYLGRPAVQRYINALINNPQQALMTESKDEFDGHTLKCESLIKPLFFLFLVKEKVSSTQKQVVLNFILEEFVGRCLSNYKMEDKEATPFTDFFAPDLAEKEKKEAWLNQYCKETIGEFESSHGDLLKVFFSLDDLRASTKKQIAEKMVALSGKVLEEIKINVDMKKVSKLKHFGSCGDIMWPTIMSWAEEMDIPKEAIDEAFGTSQAQIYVCHALTHRSSKERLSEDMLTSDATLSLITKKVTQENSRGLKAELLQQAEKFAVDKWKSQYMEVHSPLVMPMTKQQIIEASQTIGIQVSMENFSTVYRRYDEKLMLVRNACQIPGCPHFLVPHRNFNQHLSVERERPNFPHSLHKITHDFASDNMNTVIKEVISGNHAGTKDRRRPSPPELSSLDSLKMEIEELQQKYRKG